MAARLVYMTFPNPEAALAVGRHLVESRLAACANLLPGATSVYRWEGKITEDREAVLIAKTSEERMSDLRAAVKERHPYTLPCIVALAIDESASHKPYLDWIFAETR